MSEFGAKVLGESDRSGSVLFHPPRLLDELDEKVLPKFLTIQQVGYFYKKQARCQYHPTKSQELKVFFQGKFLSKCKKDLFIIQFKFEF